MKSKTKTPAEALAQRARSLALWGLVSRWDEVKDLEWVPQLLQWEEEQKAQRSLERRIRNSRIGRFKPMADFDWDWPRKIERAQVDELFTLDFIPETTNVILAGPNGVGKSMIAKNLAHQAVMEGHTVLFTTAAHMLADLVVQDSSAALQRRLRRYVRPALLVIDEIGYLSYDNRHADLLFEVVTRRYEAKPTIVTTNKSFAEWGQIFPDAACVVTLVDRLVHNSEIVEIAGGSYRLKEATERASRKARSRAVKKARGGHP